MNQTGSQVYDWDFILFTIYNTEPSLTRKKLEGFLASRRLLVIIFNDAVVNLHFAFFCI